MEEKKSNNCVSKIPISKYVPYIKAGIIVGLIFAVVITKKNTLKLSDAFILFLSIKCCI